MAPREKARPSAHRRSLTVVVLLSLAAVLAGVAVYITTTPNGCRTKPDAPQPKRSLAEEVLAAARPLLRPGGYQGARNLLRAYVSRNPSDVEVRPMLAEAQMALGEMVAAQRTVTQLLKLEPTNAQGLWLAGELARRQGRDPMECFRRAADEGTGPGHGAEMWARYGTELLAAGNDDAAATYLARALNDGVRDARTLAALGYLAFRDKRYVDAEGLLTEAVSHRHTDPQLWGMLAEAQMNVGKIDEAAHTVQRGLAVRRSGRLLSLLGDVRVLQKRPRDAGDAFAEAANHADVAPVVTYRAARCYYQAGALGLAMKYVDLAAALRPGDKKVAELNRDIEDARFGRPTITGPSFRIEFDAPPPAEGDPGR